LSVGYVAVGALASVADVTGIGTFGTAAGIVAPSGAVADGVAAAMPPAGAPANGPAAARLLDDGGVAGVNPAIATASGVVCAEGSTGEADRATAEVSSGALSCFHHANRGADWHPATTATTVVTINDGSEVRFIVWMAPNANLPT
jgi:hypothetical protein